jgi:hypothetical protein
MRLLASTVAAAGLLVAYATAGTTPASGLQGVVMRGPISPVCRAGVPCDAPARVTLVFSRSGAVKARVRTSAKGRFRVALRPGRYAVRTTERVGMRPIEPRLVTVPAGRYASVTFHIDTGIR